jgi:hypothetical protein
MPCQELGSSLTQSANPAGPLSQATNPGTDGFCRKFNFAQADDMVTFVDFNPILTFAGDQLETFV